MTSITEDLGLAKLRLSKSTKLDTKRQAEMTSWLDANITKLREAGYEIISCDYSDIHTRCEIDSIKDGIKHTTYVAGFIDRFRWSFDGFSHVMVPAGWLYGHYTKDKRGYVDVSHDFRPTETMTPYTYEEKAEYARKHF